MEELEESLNLRELEAIVRAARDREHRNNRFMAALKGIDLDEDTSGKDKFEEVQRRAEAKRLGKTEEELELADFGLEIVEE